jgi:hypothetical protein
MRCFCCRKERHVKVDCFVQKIIMEEKEKNLKPKVGINVAMVKWDQSVVDVCDHVTLEGKYVSEGASKDKG